MQLYPSCAEWIDVSIGEDNIGGRQNDYGRKKQYQHKRKYKCKNL